MVLMMYWGLMLLRIKHFFFFIMLFRFILRILFGDIFLQLVWIYLTIILWHMINV